MDPILKGFTPFPRKHTRVLPHPWGAAGDQDSFPLLASLTDHCWEAKGHSLPCSTLDFKHSRKSRRQLFLKNGNRRADSPSVQGTWQSHRMTGKNSMEMPAAFPAKIHLGYPPGLILYKSYPTQRPWRAQENPNQRMTNSSGKRQLFLSWKLKQETTIKQI